MILSVFLWFWCADVKNYKNIKKYYFDIFSIEKHVAPYYQTHTKIDIDGSLVGNQERAEITSGSYMEVATLLFLWFY